MNVIFDFTNDIKSKFMLTLKQIDYALAVAKNLHFKKAADECFISPSTLSNAITELEVQLGVKLFERNNKKVMVTSLGKEILNKALNGSDLPVNKLLEMREKTVIITDQDI